MRLRARSAALLSALATFALFVPSLPAAQAGQGAPGDDSGSEMYVVRHGDVSCAPLSKTVTGTLLGMDRRYADAMIDMDIQDAYGRTIDGNGCVGSSGYGLSVHLNYTVPASGASPGTDAAAGAVSRWSVRLPADAAKVYIEVYPQHPSSHPRYGGTDESHYGMTERPGLHLASGTTGPVRLALPVASCAAPHGAGTLAGTFLSHGRVVRGVRVSAFSQASPPSDPLTQGPLGFGIWNGSAGSYRIPLLASGSGKGQPYVLIARLADGRSKTFSMKPGGRVIAGVRPCATTRFDLRF
jgi:hypothetical protein